MDRWQVVLIDISPGVFKKCIAHPETMVPSVPWDRTQCRKRKRHKPYDHDRAPLLYSPFYITNNYNLWPYLLNCLTIHIYIHIYIPQKFKREISDLEVANNSFLLGIFNYYKRFKFSLEEFHLNCPSNVECNFILWILEIYFYR